MRKVKLFLILLSFSAVAFILDVAYARMHAEINTIYVDDVSLVCTPPTVESCTLDGTIEHEFGPGGHIFVLGSGFPAPVAAPTADYPIYVVEDVDWTNGMPIPIPTIIGIVTVDIAGTFVPNPRVLWWGATPGKYDIIVDVNKDGYYNMCIDALDDNDIEVTAGFFVVPELWLGTVLGLAGCFAAFEVFHAKHKHS